MGSGRGRRVRAAAGSVSRWSRGCSACSRRCVGVKCGCESCKNCRIYKCCARLLLVLCLTILSSLRLCSVTRGPHAVWVWPRGLGTAVLSSGGQSRRCPRPAIQPPRPSRPCGRLGARCRPCANRVRAPSNPDTSRKKRQPRLLADTLCGLLRQLEPTPSQSTSLPALIKSYARISSEKVETKRELSSLPLPLQ